MNFSIVLASRDRLNLLKDMLSSLISTAKHKNLIEVIVVIDDDDYLYNSKKNELEETFAEINLKIVSRIRTENLNNDYINLAATYCSGKYFLVINDDVLFTNQNWDEKAITSIEDYLKDKPDRILYGHTNNFSPNLKFSCFPLFTREGYLALGFLMPPERHGWSADSDIFAVYNHPCVNRVLKLPELEIRHISYHTNSRSKDQINERVQKISSRKEIVNFQSYALNLAEKLGKVQDREPKKQLVVYNICGISKRENVDYYACSVNSILNQNRDDFRVCISGCMTSNEVKFKLKQWFGKKVFFCWSNEILPLNTTFNLAVKECVKYFGEFENYIYVDSGISFGCDKNVLTKMIDCSVRNDAAMVATQVDNDDGYENWNIYWDRNSDYNITPGKTVNLHCQLFTKDIYNEYNGKILPDIFASDTSESTFPYLCSAIRKKFCIAHDVFLRHELSMDGASSGFRGKAPMILYSKIPMSEICKIGKPLGFGYEECNHPSGVLRRIRHDPSLFDSNYFPINPELKNFLKENLYAPNENLNYSQLVRIIDPPCKSYGSWKPKVSCILVSHNKPDLLKESIDSVLSQTYDNWELILVDSGVLYDQGYFDYLPKDDRIKLIRSDETSETRRRKAMAPWVFNRCFERKLVSGDVVVYLCDDDIWYENAFETFANYFSENPGALAVYASQDVGVISNNGELHTQGERRATHAMGVILGKPLDCAVDYLMYCHSTKALKFLHSPEYWPESLHTQGHADGVFMDKISKFIPIYPIDIKIGMNRRTPKSTYGPSRI